MKALRKTEESRRLTGSSLSKQASGDLSLAEWLDISWFYPEGFTRERIIETDRALVVIGKTLVYKFFKNSSDAASGKSFAERWQLACKEVLRNRETAPELYLGLRLLTWVDEQPVWFTELCNLELLTGTPPRDAQDVAIVMRRIPEADLLESNLADDRGISAGQINSMAGLLSSFHLRRRSKGIRSFAAAPELLIESYCKQTFSPLDQLEKHFADLKSENRAALAELRSFFTQKLDDLKHLFYSRAERGDVVDLHGNLSASAICISPLEVEGQRVSFFFRPECDEKKLYGDVLFDISKIVVQLEVNGRADLALKLEDEYFSLNEQSYDRDLYSFALAGASLQLAAAGLTEAEVLDRELISAYISFAFRVALRLRQPFIFAVGGSSDKSRALLAAELAETSGAVVLGAESVLQELPGYSPPDDVQFLRLMTLCRRKLASGCSVIVNWPLNRLEERLKIVHLSRRFSLPYMLIKLRLSAKEKENRAYNILSGENYSSRAPGVRRLWSTSSDSWSDPLAYEQGVRHEVIDPEEHSEYLALSLLKKLGKGD